MTRLLDSPSPGGRHYGGRVNNQHNHHSYYNVDNHHHKYHDHTTSSSSSSLLRSVSGEASPEFLQDPNFQLRPSASYPSSLSNYTNTTNTTNTTDTDDNHNDVNHNGKQQQQPQQHTTTTSSTTNEDSTNEEPATTTTTSSRFYVPVARGGLNGRGLTTAHSVDNLLTTSPTSPSPTAMSISLRNTPGRGSIPVGRSQSFGGLSVRSSTGSLGSLGATPVVLGDTLRRSPRSYAGSGNKAQGTLARSGRKAVAIKVAKVPRPGRALMVFDSVKKGIGGFIQATHEDIAELMAGEASTSTNQGRVLETDKQIKSAERYLKRLEFHLAKIDELHDCYMLHQQLREGARNMARAFNTSQSGSRKDSIASVKFGYKECSQIMCAIEAQLENMLGTFSCRLKGMAGFARLVPGDVFEVVIKHGNQKWKSKGRVDKNNTQRWDRPEFTFKCLVGDVFGIKASEVRAFKTVLLGQKNCEVCHSPASGNPGLFSPHPQLMTVSVNLNGSLKLSILITWNPMDAMDESVVFYEPPARNPGSTRGRRPMSTLNPPTASSLFDSNSDLSSIPDPRMTTSFQGFRQSGDDSGIYGSATSLPSRHTLPDAYYPQSHSLAGSSPSMQHHQTNNSSSSAALTPDMRRLHLFRSGGGGGNSHDTRSIQSQPAGRPSSSYSNEFHPIHHPNHPSPYSGRPHSSYIATNSNTNNGPGMAMGVGTGTGSGYGGGDGRSSSPHNSTSSSMSSSERIMSASANVYLGQNILSTSPTNATTPQPIPEIAQAMIPGVMVQGEMVRHDPNLLVEEALGSVRTSLEDFLGQYPELQGLEELLPALDKFIRSSSSSSSSPSSSRSSSMSVSIDCAIEEAFDFLNTEDDDALDEVDEEEEEGGETEGGDGFKISDASSPSRITSKLSPDSTAKTADSGIESLARRLHDDNRMGGSSSEGSSPVPPSTGNQQVDMALLYHLSYCDRLLENLGNYGPLKCREFYALDLLQKQATILEKLLDIAKAGSEVDLYAVLEEVTSDKSLQELWALCCEDQACLYVSPDKLLAVLDAKFGQKIGDNYSIKPSRVFHHLVARVLNIPAYQPEHAADCVMTLHQLVAFCQGHGGLAVLDKLANDLRVMDRLTATASDTVIKCILTLREELPAPPCLKLIARLLVCPSRETLQSAVSYLKAINRDRVKRDKAMVVLVEGLEDHLTEVRAGCCSALSIIEAGESLDQLVHVSQTDTSSTVRRKAKEALYSLGESGKKAVETAQLATQGFQGLQMRKL